MSDAPLEPPELVSLLVDVAKQATDSNVQAQRLRNYAKPDAGLGLVALGALTPQLCVTMAQTARELDRDTICDPLVLLVKEGPSGAARAAGLQALWDIYRTASDEHVRCCAFKSIGLTQDMSCLPELLLLAEQRVERAFFTIELLIRGCSTLPEDALARLMSPPILAALRASLLNRGFGLGSGVILQLLREAPHDPLMRMKPFA